MKYELSWQIDSPLLKMWQNEYPFGYWDERIQRLADSDQPHGLEAIHVSLQLVDIYVHVLTAKLRNPAYPWYTIKENTYAPDIRDVLDKITNENEQYNLNLLINEPDGLVSIRQNDQWKANHHPFELVVTDFLGCPANIDFEKFTIEYLEDPDSYMTACNAFLNYWKDAKIFLNDIKHGFRLLPFSPASIQYLQRTPAIQFNKPIMESIIAEHNKENGVYYFWRLEADESKQENMDYRTLALYKTNIDKRIAMSRISLKLLHNLFGNGGIFNVVEDCQNLVNDPEKSSLNITSEVLVLGGDLPNS